MEAVFRGEIDVLIRAIFMAQESISVSSQRFRACNGYVDLKTILKDAKIEGRKGMASVSAG